MFNNIFVKTKALKLKVRETYLYFFQKFATRVLNSQHTGMNVKYNLDEYEYKILFHYLEKDI